MEEINLADKVFKALEDYKEFETSQLQLVQENESNVIESHDASEAIQNSSAATTRFG